MGPTGTVDRACYKVFTCTPARGQKGGQLNFDRVDL